MPELRRTPLWRSSQNSSSPLFTELPRARLASHACSSIRLGLYTYDRPKWKSVTICAPSAPKCPATLSHLKQIPVRILEPRGVTPGELKDLGWLEVHSARLQRLERHPAILHLDGINRGTQLGPAGCAWPQNELEVLPLDADGQESRSVGCWVVTPLLETDDIRVEVERLVLIAHQQRHVHHFFQHRRSSVRIIASANIKPAAKRRKKSCPEVLSLFVYDLKGKTP